MIRRPPRSTLDRSSAASDVYKRQLPNDGSRLSRENLAWLRENNLTEERLVISRKLTAFAQKELGAVSYTHLRAHETVLDLVCRLLLEKKKKKKESKLSCGEQFHNTI